MPKYEIDMSKGSIFKNLIRFAIPLLLTNLLQILYNTADTIVAGRCEGSDALAAIGATSYLHNMMVNVFLGLFVPLYPNLFLGDDIYGKNQKSRYGIKRYSLPHIQRRRRSRYNGDRKRSRGC